MADLTTIILTYNEEKNIANAINSVKKLAKRIVVVDSFSTDKTIEIAKSLGAEIIEHEFENQAKQFIYAINHLEIDTQWIMRLDADEIIIATGAKARKLRTPGIENAIEAIDYLNGRKVGKNVVIIGGGLTGCEIAYDLFNHGHNPTIVEMKNDLIAVRGVCLANSSYLRDFFNLHKVNVYLESKVIEIKKDSVIVCNNKGEKQEIKADDVIVSVGYVSNPLAKKSKHVHIIGDADKVGNLRTVVWKAWEVAEKI